MTRAKSSDAPQGKLTETSWLATAAIILFVALLLAVLADVSSKVGAAVVTQETWKDVLKVFLLALLVNTPALIVIGVLRDFAGLFSRTGEGEVFSDRNLKALRNAGGGLIWAAAASAIIVPSVLSWTTGDGRGILWDINDLALGTAAMGAAILGLSHVLAEGIRLKAESDQII